LIGLKGLIDMLGSGQSRHEEREKVVVLRELHRAIIYTTKMSKHVT
jgi:hypothetical protein